MSSPDQARVHLSAHLDRARCGHPLRGNWTRSTGLAAIRPGTHVACESCVAVGGTQRHSAQAVEASGRPEPAERATRLPDPSTWHTDQLPALTTPAARRTRLRA
ncbi:hypothetical protein [Saccharopolyspora sp. CA-218241]|uniref:hypothetical protein n=1 Tax=Saccharopolyspora sp. CA-218241 TaxID=3240027 RepID=UPI003D959AD4